MAILSDATYSKDKLDKLQSYLRLQKEKSRPVEYEIVVDGMKVVGRTADPEEFSDYTEFHDANTENIEVILYTGTSNYNNKHVFRKTSKREEPMEKGLSGLEIEGKIMEGINNAKQNWDFEQLKKENGELEEYIEELEGKNTALETEVTSLKAKQSPLNGFIGEVGASMVETLIKNNPQLLKKIPGAGLLAGLKDTDKTTTKQEPENETGVRIEIEDEQSEADKAALAFVNQLKERFNQQEFDKVLEVLKLLSLDKTQLDNTLNYLNQSTTKQ